MHLKTSDGISRSTSENVAASTFDSVSVATTGRDDAFSNGPTVHFEDTGAAGVDGDGRTLLRTLVAIPACSRFSLSNPSSKRPPRAPGDPDNYIKKQTVDRLGRTGKPAPTTFSRGNLAQVVDVGKSLVDDLSIVLDGSRSSDNKAIPSFTAGPIHWGGAGLTEISCATW